MKNERLGTENAYSVDNAIRYSWASVTGGFNGERIQYLREYLVGPKVLDAGCGGGAYVDFLSRQGFEVTGVDKHDMFLAIARERGLQGRFVQADLDKSLPFPDKEFDSAFCFDVLEHVDDEAAIREIARVTRKRMVIAVPQEDRRKRNYLLTYWPYRDQTHLRYYTPEGISKLAAVVEPAKIQVVQEGRVPLEFLLHTECAAQSRFRWLTPLYQAAYRFLSARVKATDWYVGLLCVIDLV